MRSLHPDALQFARGGGGGGGGGGTGHAHRSGAGVAAATDARRAAADICADLRGGQLLDVAFGARTTTLDARDRRWVQELVYGMLRRRSWLDAALSERVTGGLARLDPDLIDLLRLGVDQLLFMGSVPAYAAIAQSVELAKERHGIGASRLVNAVLRRVERERDDLTIRVPGDPIDALALRSSHPRWLVARWVSRWGAEETERLLEWNNVEPPLIVRPYGIGVEQLQGALQDAGLQVSVVPLTGDSLKLDGATISLAELGVFRKGQLFVQDPGATLVTRYADVPVGATVVDLCAAPGGKTLELSRTASSVIAIDRSAPRLQRLIANLRRVGADNVVPLLADARQAPLASADAVLLDAPCTGTGTLRRHPDARWRLKVSDLAVMAALQRALLRAAAALVRPGGLLVYSTCSLEPEENDEQVERFLADHPEWRLEPPSLERTGIPAAVVDAGRLRVLPQRHGADGAFAARLRRHSS
ncbi:MAG TPA: 16S rRNA (cytosine(967)-C(5))-methyltransferase RsmB [Gemmatimonadaceae bacterium]|nr:16S rRNA (cytosine(967)-C(5))-methyltransferase RsmB [Gemmatimonadaceae bacterium]